MIQNRESEVRRHLRKAHAHLLRVYQMSAGADGDTRDQLVSSNVTEAQMDVSYAMKSLGDRDTETALIEKLLARFAERRITSVAAEVKLLKLDEAMEINEKGLKAQLVYMVERTSESEVERKVEEWLRKS